MRVRREPVARHAHLVRRDGQIGKPKRPERISLCRPREVRVSVSYRHDGIGHDGAGRVLHRSFQYCGLPLSRGGTALHGEHARRNGEPMRPNSDNRQASSFPVIPPNGS